ncbi:MAG: hypothetical protein H6739_29255 [Alphaproteobacteria bacterium]|nr:hypothetical protein [Alphaproteobacteria bacterium]
MSASLTVLGLLFSSTALAGNYTLTVTVQVPDWRTWCEEPTSGTNSDRRPESYCHQGAGTVVPLPNAYVQVISGAGAGYAVADDVTDEDGVLVIDVPQYYSGPLKDLRIRTTFVGYPRSPGASFQVFDSDATTATDLKDESERAEVYADSGTFTCPSQPLFGGSCNGGTQTINLSTDLRKMVAATYLDYNYLYSQDDLYVEDYHDYCKVNGCPNEDSSGNPLTDLDYAVVAVSDQFVGAGTALGTGYVLLGYSSTNQAYVTGGTALRQFGAALMAWSYENIWPTAYDYNSDGQKEQLQAWANFVRTVYQYEQDAVAPLWTTTDYETQPTLDSGTGYADWTNTANWVRSFWDLYDSRNEGGYNMGNCSNQPDMLDSSLEEMMDALRYQVDGFTTLTDNGAVLEDQGSTDEGTNNLWDFAEAYIAAHGLSGPWDVYDTLLLHNCMDNLPSD